MSEINELAGGRYLIQEPLGEGGSGSIFKAWDQQLGRMVALKRIKENPSIEASIQHEAAVLAGLDHPNVVTVFDFGGDEYGHYVVMELLNGRTLEAIVQEQPLSVSKFIPLMNQICRGLAAAHSAGLVHCDLKPANIMMQLHRDGSYTTKILDFGLATTSVSTAGTGAGANGEGQTIQGSPLTIAPEQLMGFPADVRSDIYALGCTFYYALTGVYAHDADDVQTIVQNHLYSKVKPPHRINSDIPEPLSLALMKMLSREPDQRPQDAEKVRAALEGAARAPSLKRGANLTSRVIPNYSQPPIGRGSSTILPPPQPMAPSAAQPQPVFQQYASDRVPQAAPAPNSGMRMQVIISCSSLLLIAILGGVFWWSNKKDSAEGPAKGVVQQVAPPTNSTNSTSSNIENMLNSSTPSAPVIASSTPSTAYRPEPTPARPVQPPPARPAQPAPARPVASTSSANKSNAPVISSRDTNALNANQGKLVRVESQVESSMESKAARGYLLRLRGSSAALVVPTNLMNAQAANDLVGKQISAVGTVGQRAGVLVIQIDSAGDIQSH